MSDWTDIYRTYPGKWVAIDASDEETVVASGPDARVVFEEAQKSGKRAILHKVPETVVDLVGYEISL